MIQMMVALICQNLGCDHIFRDMEFVYLRQRSSLFSYLQPLVESEVQIGLKRFSKVVFAV